MVSGGTQAYQLGPALPAARDRARAAIKISPHLYNRPVARLHDKREVDDLGVLAMVTADLEERVATADRRRDRGRGVVQLSDEQCCVPRHAIERVSLGSRGIGNSMGVRRVFDEPREGDFRLVDLAGVVFAIATGQRWRLDDAGGGHGAKS